ncbi:MAG: thymidine phosphorylase, partial [Burkholderiaceae bacterium]
GGGRRQAADRIDHRVGFSEVIGLGARVRAGDPLAVVHAADEQAAQAALAGLRRVIVLSDTPPHETRTLYTRLAGD